MLFLNRRAVFTRAALGTHTLLEGRARLEPRPRRTKRSPPRPARCRRRKPGPQSDQKVVEAEQRARTSDEAHASPPTSARPRPKLKLLKPRRVC